MGSRIGIAITVGVGIGEQRTFGFLLGALKPKRTRHDKFVDHVHNGIALW